MICAKYFNIWPFTQVVSENVCTVEGSVAQTGVRYMIDTVTGVAAAYGLDDQNILAQAIGIVSAVSMSDIAMKVGLATAELGLNGVSNMFDAGDCE